MTDWGVPSTYRTRTDCCICSRQFLSARFDRIAACAFMSGFYDPSLEESGFEPLVPSERGRALLRADRDLFRGCPANCETNGGTKSSNPSCSSGESGELRHCAAASSLAV